MNKKLLLIVTLSLVTAVALAIGLYSLINETNQNQQVVIDYTKYPYYQEMMDDLSVNVYDVIAAGNAYFENHDKGKGSGYKQFQRWILLNEDQFYPSGNRTNFNPLLPYEIRSMYETGNTVPSDNPTFEGVTTAVMSENNWEEIGPAVELKTLFNDTRNGNGRVDAIWVNPADANHIYVGTRGGGFWVTNDGGTTWSPKTDQLGITGVNSIAVNPSDVNEVYIATSAGGSGNYSIGIFKSTDAGNTWVPTGYALDIAMDLTVIYRIILDPSNPAVLFAATSKGLLKTTDGFQTFTNVLSGKIIDVELKPGDANIIYASSTTDNMLYKSSDGGNSFVSTGVSTSGKMQVAVSPAAPDNVYVSDKDYFAISTDNGNTFVQGGSPDEGKGQYGGFNVSDTNPDLIINGTIDTYLSTNQGNTFSKVTNWIYGQSTGVGSNFVHADIREIEVVNGVIYLGTDGWLVRSTDGGYNYDILTYSMGNHEIYEHGLGVSQADDNTLIVGTQDNGTSVLYDGVWHHWKGGDGGTSVADYSNNDILYGSLYNGDFKRTENAGKTNNNFDLGDTKPGSLPPLVQHPSEPATLFLGEGNGEIWKSTDKGSTWTTIAHFGGTNVVDELAVATSDPQNIYASVKNQIWKTTDGGNSWNEISGSLPNLVIKGIAVDHDDPNHVVICYTGYSAGEKAYQTIDGGTNWSNISAGLPNLNSHDVVFQKSADDGLYLATDVGVYYRNNSSSDWALYGSGLPNCVVNDVEIQHATGDLYVATWGRGVWKIQVVGGSLLPIADFTADKRNIDVGGQVTFTDQSSKNPTAWLWSFPGGKPSTSIGKNPVVTYNTPGLYSVGLTVGNSNGTHTLTKSGYIEVNTTGTGEPNLEVYYPFDENTADYSGFGRHGILSGYEDYEEGIFEKAFAFNGSNSISTNGFKGILGANARSVAVWLKTTVDGSIASWGGTATAQRFTFRLDGGKLRVEIAGSYVVGSTSISDGEWHHVAFTFTEDDTPSLENITFYVDGQEDAVSSIGAIRNVNTTEGSDVVLGAYPYGANLQGAMDEFRIYSKTLSATRIAELADRSIPGLVSHYNFSGNLIDEGSNKINFVSNYGDVSYVSDREGLPSEAYVSPGVADQYLEIPGYKGISGNGARSVTAWIKTTEAGTRKTILSWGANAKGQMFNLMLDANNVRVEGGASSVWSLDGTVEDDNWHHIAYIFDPNDGNGSLASGKIYIDGVLQTNTGKYNGGTILNTTANNDVRLGATFYNAGYFFQGSFDDVRIYNRAITVEEINAMFSETMAGPLFNYHFDNDLFDSGSLVIEAVSNYGAVTYSTDRLDDFSGAYEAPGQSAQYLTIPGYKGIEGSSARTVAAWIRTTEAGGRKTILSWGNNAKGQMFNFMVIDNNVRIEGGTCSILSVDGAIEDNKWHHVAYTFDPTDGSTLSAGKIYIDGVLQTNVSGYNHTSVNINTVALEDVRIGDAQYNANYFFQGSFEDVALFNKALSAQEILDLAGEFPEPDPEFPLSVRYLFEGNLEDISEYDRNASTTGTPVYTAGPNAIGQAYELDGTNALTIPGYLGELKGRDRTVATWFKTTQNNKVIVNWGTPATGQKITFKTHSNGNLRLEVAGGYIVGSVPVADGEWHHVAFTFENDGTPDVSEALLYVDGKPDVISSAAPRVINTVAGGDVLIGRDDFAGSTIGALEDFRIYSIALTPEEIASLTVLPATGLVSDYGFNSNLEDDGTNGITAVSNFGIPVFVADKNDMEQSAWLAPNVSGTNLTVTGYKGITGNTSRTVSAWVKPEIEGTRKTIVSWGENEAGGMFNLMVSDGEVRVEGGTCNVSTSGANLEDGKWHHIAYTFDKVDGGTITDGKIYVDGILWAETTNYRGGTMLNTAYGANVIIGETFYNSNYFFRGTIDDVRIYDYVVNAEELRNEFCAIAEPIVAEILTTEDTVYFGYESAECTTLSIDTLRGGYGELTYFWNTGDTTPTITECPEYTSTYTLYVSDASGCQTAEVSVDITAIDVHCGKNDDKVLVCHNGNTICISHEDVIDHLSHGDHLGECIDEIYEKSASIPPFEEEISIYPNPFDEQLFINAHAESLEIYLHNAVGILVKKKNIEKVNGEIRINVKGLTPGVYYLKLLAGDQQSVTKLLKK